MRRHKWKSKSRRWTSRQLTRERRDFFDTRVTGRPKIWQTIHAALEALWADPTGQDPDALALAQTILSAAEISLPTGNLANGVYDSLGNFYALHAWVVCDPTNLAPDDEGDDGEGDDGEEDDEEGDANTKDILSSSGTRSTKDHPDGRNELNGDGDASAAAAGEQKGKAAAQTEEKVTLRIRLSENGRDYNVPVTMSESVRSVVKKAGQVVSVRRPLPPPTHY